MKADGHTGKDIAKYLGINLPAGLVRNHSGESGFRADVQVRRTKERKGGQWQTGTLKSKRSRRTVPLPPWLAERMHAYLTARHPHADNPTPPLRPSRKNGGGYRAKGQRYAVPFDWSAPLALGSFYDTVLKPAFYAVGLPASRPATEDASATRGTRLHDLWRTAAVLYLVPVYISCASASCSGTRHTRSR